MTDRYQILADFLREFEGYEHLAYQDSAGVWTIGIGSTGPNVKQGLHWDDTQIMAAFARDTHIAAAAVDRNAIEPTDNEWAAMVSLTFNIGIGAFAKSTVLREHNARNKQGAAKAFGMWNLAGGKVNNGLVRRRKAEAKLYLKAPASC